MNNAALLTAIKNQHAFDVADRQMGEQRIIDLMEKRLIPLETDNTWLKIGVEGLSRQLACCCDSR